MVDGDDPILVVGGGAAAHACVTSYRDAGGERPVVMVSADDRPPYFRPAVSKEYLTGDLDAGGLDLAPRGWYAAADVELRLECEVTAIDVGGRRALATAADPIRWSHCVLATGSAARRLPVPGADDPAVLTLRRAADAERLLATVDGPVVIVGSGFVGCEAAAGLRHLGHDVTIVTTEQAPQHDRLGAPVGRLLTALLRDLGVALVSGRTVDAFERHGDELAVRLDDGRTLGAGTALVAVGAEPCLTLATGLDVVDDGRDGVAVDAQMRTGAPGVFAVGDIAAAWHPVAGRRLRVEHWGDAVAHGEVAGRVLAGGHATWSTPPGFWSTIGGQTLKHVAWGDGHDELVVRTSSSGETYWYGRDGVVVGVLTHDHDEDGERAATALVERWPMPS